MEKQKDIETLPEKNDTEGMPVQTETELAPGHEPQDKVLEGGAGSVSVEMISEDKNVSNDSTVSNPQEVSSADEGKEEKQSVDEGKKGSDRKKKKLPKWLRRLIKLLTKITVLVAAGFALWHWVGNVYITHDNNMYPHIKDGDLVITYKLKGYYNGDPVLYRTDDGFKVGRIVAKGGDEVVIQSDGLYTVDGSIPYENVYYSTLPVEGSSVEYPYEVQEGEYFILNDMREMTEDSRVVGSIPEEDLCGTVQIIVRHRGM